MTITSDKLKKAVDDLERGRQLLTELSALKSFQSFRIAPTLPILLTAYTYLSTNIQTLYQLALRDPDHHGY